MLANAFTALTFAKDVFLTLADICEPITDWLRTPAHQRFIAIPAVFYAFYLLVAAAFNQQPNLYAQRAALRPPDIPPVSHFANAAPPTKLPVPSAPSTPQTTTQALSPPEPPPLPEPNPLRKSAYEWPGLFPQSHRQAPKSQDETLPWKQIRPQQRDPSPFK